MEEKRITAPLTVKEDAPEGSVTAVVSVFDVLDSDGDVVRSGAFTEGQELPMVWSHQWANPIGKGVIKVEKKRAVFEGQFFMDTIDGEQAFRKVKNMGDLQEWSWGFRVKAWEMGEFEEIEGVRFITDTEVFEVSPVLVGANRETVTLAVKAKQLVIPEIIGRVARVIGDGGKQPDWEDADRDIGYAQCTEALRQERQRLEV